MFESCIIHGTLCPAQGTMEVKNTEVMQDFEYEQWKKFEKFHSAVVSIDKKVDFFLN